MTPRERPILSMVFSGPMVRAILDGRKTQTRRIMRPQPEPSLLHAGKHWVSNSSVRTMLDVEDFLQGPDTSVAGCFCPYGGPGNRLWVRETFQLEDASEYGPERTDPAEGPTHLANPGEEDERLLIPRYRATAPDTVLEVVEHDGDNERDGMRWRSPIHMPRWASRITLEITDVRVERLQDITTEDIIAEGFSTTLREHDACADLREQYRAGWGAINGKRAPWESNPWVWVVTFKRVQEGEA